MIKFVLLILGLMLVAACAMALVAAFVESSAWGDYFDNERDGNE